MTATRVDLPKKVAFLFKPHRYKVLVGGRGGAKSWSIARALILKAMSSRTRVLCTREFQLSIRDSVHRLLCDQIDRLGYAGHFNTTRNVITCATGSEFLFSGMHANVSKIRSMEGVDIVWVEEAEAVSEESWAVLVPTIRKAGSEIWISFNPDKETDPTYRRFIINPPPGAKVIQIGWRDNPWLPLTLLKEKDYLYQTDSDAAEHVWGGKTRQLSKAQVLYGKVSVEPFEPKGSDWHGPYYGADWGFANDPTVLVKCWVKGAVNELERELYVEHEAYGVGVDIDETPSLFESVPGSKEHTIRADNARPETISHMVKHGYPRMLGCEKGPGSVKDGVAHLRGYKRIVIHPRCKHAITETRLWSYKLDKLTGDVLPVLVEKNDHIPDALRYAVEPLIKKTGVLQNIDIGVATRSQVWSV